MLATTTPEARALALVAQCHAALDTAEAHTDAPSVRYLAQRYRRKVEHHERVLSDPAQIAFRDADASHTLAMLGPNGLLPAIDSLVTDARLRGMQGRGLA